MPDLTGQSIGRYHILERIGQGGMALVYRAYDTRLEREVAVKVIRREAFPPEQLERILKRFEREAKSLARLEHANIVRVHDYGEHEGAPYLVMQYVRAGTLKERTGKPVPWQEAAELLKPVAQALAYAHQRGILHRDVKPSNILITEEGQPVLTDFGIARLLDAAEGQTLTGTGMGVGTPEYMAPEQGLGREVDARADVYSLGIVLYELITGRKPYTADTPFAVLLKQTTEPLPDPKRFAPDLPEAAEQALFKALAKQPAERYKDMTEFAAVLAGDGSAQAEGLGKAMQQKMAAATPSVSSNPSKMESTHPDPGETTDLPPARTSGASEKIRPDQPGTGQGKIPPWAWLTALVLVVGIGIGLILGGDGGDGEKLPTETPLAGIQIPAENSTEPTSAPDQKLTAASPTQEPTTIPPTDLPAVGIGSIRTREKDGMLEVIVPAGSFRMGSNEGSSDEQPVHEVYLDDYWIDRTEVSNDMYAKCVQDGDCSEPSSKRSYTRDSYYGNSEYADYPVIDVSWQQASDYCAWAGGRLPTEAEWEKAARGEDGRTYPWGNQTPGSSLANFSVNVGDTTQVGSYPAGASQYGALDMAGNVWEWVADWYGETYYRSQTTWNNPQGPETGEYRGLRGGSWSDDDDLLRSADRYWYYPADTYNYYGFRCLRSD